jgi:hypothetical protein
MENITTENIMLITSLVIIFSFFDVFVSVISTCLVVCAIGYLGYSAIMVYIDYKRMRRKNFLK